MDMLTSQVVYDSVKEFQDLDLDSDSNSNVDYLTLLQQKSYLENRLLRKKYYTKRLQLLYSQIDKTRNYQEFVDLLMNSRDLLREIFTMEGQDKNAVNMDLDIDWSKFGLDISEYIANDDQLLALYNDGLL